MSGLILPRSVLTGITAELRERTASFYEDVIRSIEVRPDDSLLLEYNERLQAIDPRLMMVRARETVVPGVPMKPGYYHILVQPRPGVPLSVTVIEGEHGEYVEPTSRVFEKLAAGDLRERRNLDRMSKATVDEAVANAREQASNREERQQHLSELVKAYTQASVSMHGDWTQNQAGRRDAGERRKRKP